MDNQVTLTCQARVEWQNSHGVATRNLNYRKAQFRLLRNENKTMFVEIGAEKQSPIKMELKAVTVHNKFKSEGKASFKFTQENCIVYLSNAPVTQLDMFLETIFIKMRGQKAPSNNVPLRNQLLSVKNRHYEEVSPVTLAEVVNARKQSKSTDTTPSPLSRKRRPSDPSKAPPAKKANTISSLFSQPLNAGQKEVYDACMSGVNVFFTGSAGTGKSYLLKKIIGALPPDVTRVTASTGVAASHINGTTLHNFAGIGGGDATLERACEMASKSAAAQVWRKCKHLIIDEISMIDGHYFEKIESVARRIRKNDKPFGGIQLIICGDFFQLPPVVDTRGGKKLRFSFQTKAWDACVQRFFELRQVHRQSDPRFIGILNDIRLGNVTQSTIDVLTKTSKQKIEQNGILATRLCSHTQEANTINESKLDDLQGEEKIFTAHDSDQYQTKTLDQHLTVPGKLVLKVNAQVMLLKNISISTGLVNGARGVVKGFKNGLPVVQFRAQEYVAKPEKWTIKVASGVLLTRTQVPLKLAWAFSIHKSQGLTLDCVEMSLARVFESGQAYVALSRAQSLETLRVLDFKPAQVWANPDVLEFYKSLRDGLEEAELSKTVHVPLGPKTLENIQRKKPGKKLFSSKPLVSIS